MCKHDSRGLCQRPLCIGDHEKVFKSFLGIHTAQTPPKATITALRAPCSVLYVAPEGPAAFYELRFSSGSILAKRERALMGISQDLCGMLDFDCSGEIVMIFLKDSSAHYYLLTGRKMFSI